METLAARGMDLDVTRMLGAGEVPVQVVDGASLPAVAGERRAGRRRASAPRRRVARPMTVR